MPSRRSDCQLSDYIIVGSGSAGSVLANRLSKSNTVTLLEAGPMDHRWDFRLHMPAALSHVLSNDRYNWFYHSQPEAGLNHRRMYCPRGRVLGGSSSINGMIFVRGHAEDFNAWSELPGLEDWSYESCLPYFRRSESRPNGDQALRGDDGPMLIQKAPGQGELNEAWLQAVLEAGYRTSDDFNGINQEGAGHFDASIHGGRRMSTARAYLDECSDRQNLTILPHALTTKILIENGRAVGVEVSRGRSVERLYANAEVIVSAGAINSPQLLMLSGIGPADHLNAHDIVVVNDLPGVGENLQDHLEIYVQYTCKKPVSIYPALKWYRQPFVGLAWYLFHKGPGATNHFETGAFLKSEPGKIQPDLQFHFLPVAMNYDGSDVHKGHGFQVHVGPMKPTSRGNIRLRDNKADSTPLIQFNYNSTREDAHVMRRGIEVARDIVSQPAFNALRGEEIRPGPEDMDSFIRKHAESAYHPSCTCKMGLDDMSVVDGQGRVHNMDGLRVVDASIMPSITNGNLNAPTIMMAEKISDDILRSRS